MIRAFRDIPAPHCGLGRFRRSEDGASLVEFSLVVGLVLLIFFAILDFGRIGYAFVMGQKAVQNAARMAATRPAACNGLPSRHVLRNTQLAVDFGTSCSDASAPCEPEAPVTCAGSAGNPTALAIHAAVRPILPPSVGVDGLTYSYTYDPGLGFLGGPYTPMVTVEMANAAVPMVSPLGNLMGLFTTYAQTPFQGDFALPTISVSLPAESLE